MRFIELKLHRFVIWLIRSPPFMTVATLSPIYRLLATYHDLNAALEYDFRSQFI